MSKVTFQTKISKGKIIELPESLDLKPGKVTVTIEQSSDTHKKNPNSFVEKWEGFLSGTSLEEVNDPKVEYLLKKHL